jgi:hypothetical protein
LINLTAKQLARKPKKIGKLNGKDVQHLVTKGGWHVVVGTKDGQFEPLGVGPHPAVARFEAQRRAPDIQWTELNKSEWVDPIHFQDILPRYSAITDALRKAMSVQQGRGFSHPHSYPWHDVELDEGAEIQKAEEPKLVLPPADSRPQGKHPHTDGAIPGNDQAAGAGVSTYAKFAAPYGTIKPGTKSNLLHYDYRPYEPQLNAAVQKHGYNVYLAGGSFGKPDLARRNYNTGHLMIYDPTPKSGGDFGEEAYTRTWRTAHELAHALTYPELNAKYGEGRRIGKLGTHRTLREAKRAVEWEWLAAHKQREMAAAMGHHIPDDMFHRELNTVMHDAVHRAVTGQFTEPSDEGFHPHSHKVPLEHALATLDQEAARMGLKGHDDLVQKKPARPMVPPQSVAAPVVRAK